MLVFIDESGDAGFRIDRGSSEVFAAGMVIFRDSEDAQATEICIDAVSASLNLRREFKFSKDSNETRDAFFAAVKDMAFSVRAIVVRKSVIYSPRLRTDQEKFYNYFVRQMMSHDDGVLEEAKIVIDGRGERRLRREFERYMKQQLGSAVKTIKFKDSGSDRLVQLADMCIGAIARSRRTDRKHGGRWLNLLQAAGRIDDIWDFR